MTIGRTLLLLFGVVFVLGGLGLVAGGGVLVWVYHWPTDEEGFYTTGPIPIERSAYAVVTGPYDIDETKMDWPYMFGLGPYKVRGSSNDPEEDIFIGVASGDQVEAYLEGVNHDELTQFKLGYFGSFLKLASREAEYTNHPGESAPVAPVTRSFWSQRPETGPGTQTLEWEPALGSHALVLMNADGSEGIDIDVEFMAQVPTFVLGWGVGGIVGGVDGLLLGALMIYFSVRRR